MVQCRHCKQIGHVEATCPMKTKNHTHQVTSPNTDAIEESQSHNEVELDTLQATLEGGPSAYLASEKTPQHYTWVIDSGCSHHMTLISDNYISYIPYPSPQTVYLTNKSTIDAIREGTVKLFTVVNGAKHEVHLHNMLLVPGLTNSLFLVKTVNCLGFSALFRLYGVLIKNPNKMIIAKSEEGRSLYDLHIICKTIPMASTAHASARIPLNILHNHLGHPSPSTLQQMLCKGLIKG